MASTMAKEAGTTFSSRVDIPAEQRQALVELLNQNLANLSDLYTQTKFAHWNVRGNDFYQLHKLFDELAEVVEENVDLVAERAGAVGGVARGTARMAAKNSALEEFPQGVYQGMEVVDALANRFAKASNEARQSIDQAEEHDDAVTADLFTDVVNALDESLYFLQSHLQK